MAKGILDYFDSALGNPLIGLGVGLLGAPEGANFGQAVQHGVSTATDLRARANRNELAREAVLDRKNAREEQARRQAAWQELLKVLGVPGDESGAAASAAATSATAPGGGRAAAGGGAPVNLLEAFPGAAAQPAAAPGSGAPGSGVPGSGVPGSGVPGSDGGAGQATLMGLLAQAQPDAFAQGILGTMFRRPRSDAFANKVALIEQKLKRPLTEDELLEMTGGIQINTGGTGELDKPYSLTDLERLRDAEGNLPPIGTTPRMAVEGGYQVVPADQRSSEGNLESVLTVLGQLESLALGGEEDPGIFQNVEPGLMNRGRAAVDFFFDLLDQGDPRVAQYQDLSQGAIATIVRSLGEKGSLAEGDVDRALSLVPRIFPLPDTGPVARDKIDQLRSIIAKGYRNFERGVDLRGGKKTGEAGAGKEGGDGKGSGAEGFINRLPGTREELEKLTDQEVLELLELR